VTTKILFLFVLHNHTVYVCSTSSPYTGISSESTLRVRPFASNLKNVYTSVIATSEWKTGDDFLLLMEHFIKHIMVTKYKLTFLLLDNYPSHLSLRLPDLAKEN
jgi:hypothetical protein